MAQFDHNRGFDFLIIGGGVVGLSVAWALKEKRPESRVAVLEKEKRLGVHASGRNSGVLHSGIYYAPGTLKAQFCVEGARAWKKFAREHKVPVCESGKVIVATSEQEVAGLDRLMKNAHANGVKASRLSEKDIQKIEPHARAPFGGIHCPETAVIDSLSAMNALKTYLEKRGVSFLLDESGLKIDVSAQRVHCQDGKSLHYGYLINCAGAWADQIARQFGLCQNDVLLPFKGLFFQVHPQKNHVVSGSIYPVPNLQFPFLGIHLTKDVKGNLYAGPTAIPALGRSHYGLWKGIQPAEFLKMGKNLLSVYIKNQENVRGLIHREIQHYFKGYFFKSLSRLVSGIDRTDLVPSSKVGIRPQLVNRTTGKLKMDFLIERTPQSLHVLNAISPGWTTAIPFGQYVVDQIEKA